MAGPVIRPESKHVQDVIIRALFDTAHDAIGVSVAGIHTMVNAAYLRLFGYEREEELVGRPILDLIAPQSHADIGAKVAARSRGDPIGNRYETRGMRKDGSQFDMEVQVSPYALDGVVHTLATLRDVTEMRRQAEELREGQAFYRALFEVNSAVKILVDPATGDIVDANSAAAEFYGYPLDVLKRMNLAQINAAPRENVVQALGDASRGERRFFTFQHRRATGDLRDVEIHTGPFQHRGRTLLMSIIHDVTERIRLDARLRQGQKLEALGRLAGGVAHDFNNILTAIIGHGSLALDLSTGEARDHLDELLRNARRAGALTRQLLAVSRQQVLQPRLVDPVEVVRGMESMLRRVLGERVVLEVEAPPGLPGIMADPGQLEQVVLNLAANGRDAMPRGGTLCVKLGTARGAGQPVVGGSLPVGDWVTLAVRDSGSGMDEATAARVFDPFLTVREQTVVTGLGLTTVYGIVQQSGGHVAVESTPGQGTCFTVYLPAAAEPSRPVTERPAATVRRAATVLVVEDNDDVRRFLVLTLRRGGHRVLEAADADQALRTAAAETGPVDLLVSDVIMPGKSGPEVFHALAAARPELRVLYISGFADGQLDEVPAGAAFLQKPFTGRDLEVRVQALLAELPPA